MLGKVLKYDMKSMNKAMIPGYLIIFVLALLAKGMFLLGDQFTFMKSFTALFLAVFIFAVFGIFFYVFLASVLRFYKSFTREEGYLTHTIPASKNVLLLSKLLSFLFHFLFTCVVVIAAMALLIPDYSILGELWKEMNAFITTIGYSTTWVVIYLIFMILISVLSNILLFYLSMCLGQTHNDKKVLYSIVYGVALYSVVQMIGVIFTLILGLTHPGMMEQASSAAIPDKTFINLLFGYSSVLSVVLVVIYYVASVYILDKKLNLE